MVVEEKTDARRLEHGARQRRLVRRDLLDGGEACRRVKGDERRRRR
jgi:hypothetical protein